MITLAALAQLAAETLRDNQPIADWVQAEYGKDVKVIVGLDARKPPGIKDCPFVLVRAPSMSGGLESESDDYTLMIDWGLNEPGIETVEDITRYKGHAMADALGNLILDAVFAMTDSMVPMVQDYEIESEMFFPLIAGGATLAFSMPNTIGAGITL